MYYAENIIERVVELEEHNLLSFRAVNSHFQFSQKSDTGTLNLRIVEHVRAKTKEKANIYLSQFNYKEETQNEEKIFRVVEPVVDKEQNEAAWLLVQAEVPGGIDFSLHLKAGHVTGDGFEGGMALYGGQGNVELTSMQGTTNVSLENGNIYIGSTGGDISALSRKGNIALRSTLDGCEKLEGVTVMGNLDLYVPSEQPFSIKAATRSGTVHLQMDIDEIISETPNELIGNNRGGGTQIHLQVQETGSISIQDLKYIPERRWHLKFPYEGP